MRRIIAIITALALCACILCPSAVPVSAADGDEIRAPKKIISVVYDDSGSMYGDRWVYTSYAMQALTALLNEQDVLYITYMSRPGISMKVELSDLEKAVRDIRFWGHSSGTPGESLDTARETLQSVTESDQSTQFWCVILTDGEIDMDMTIQEKLNSFKGTPMSNGTDMNVVYLAMGPGAVAAHSDTQDGLYAFDAADSGAISDTMAEIANLISGRITADNVKQIDGTTISFQSELPLYSISILSQESAATVVSASSAEEQLHIDRNIALNAMEPFGTCDTTLTGNAAVVNLNNGTGSARVIQPGVYTITFSEPVDKDDLLVQYEPAIGMKLEITRDGDPVDDVSGLQIGDKVSIRMIPVNPGTGDPIADSSLPKGLSWNIEYIVEDTQRERSASDSLKKIQLEEGWNVIRGTMRIPGFAPSIYEISFKLEPVVYNFGIIVEQPDPLDYYRKDMGGQNSGENLTFRLTNDGIPLSAEEQDRIGVRLKTMDVVFDNAHVEPFLNRFGMFPADCTLTRNDDGSYTLIPDPIIPFTAFLTYAGAYTVTVGVDADPGVTAVGTFNLIAQWTDWIDLIIVVLLILMVIWLVYVLFIKYKFNNQTVYYEVFRLTPTGRGSPLTGSTGTFQLKRFGLNTWWPFSRAATAQFCGLTFQAGPGGSVVITGKSIAKTAERYGPSVSNPLTSLRSIVTALRSSKKTAGKKTTVIATDQSLSANRPIYFQTYQTDATIWRIRITN